MKYYTFMLFILYFGHNDELGGLNLNFGNIMFVKAQCSATNLCSPDPTCFKFIAPTTKCLEFTAWVD